MPQGDAEYQERLKNAAAKDLTLAGLVNDFNDRIEILEEKIVELEEKLKTHNHE